VSLFNSRSVFLLVNPYTCLLCKSLYRMPRKN
jgi:hypothetical protein